MSALRSFSFFVVFAMAAVFPVLAGEKKDDKIAFEVYAKGHFVKNTVKLEANPTFGVIQDKKTFDQYFGIGVVMGGKPKLVDDKVFESNVVVTVIKSGSTLWKYEVEQVTRVRDRLVVKYAASGKESPSATFNSPLIFSVPRGDFAEVMFIENGKEIGKTILKK
jgi:hypothetical protein